MGYDNRYTGEITITPPLTATEIRHAPSGRGSSTAWDAHLRITATTEDTDTGEVTRYTADAIVGPENPCNGYDVKEQIQALIDLYADGHRFTGWVQVDWDAGFRELPTRYVVRDGRVAEVQPRLLWPGEAIRSAHGEGI